MVCRTHRGAAAANVFSRGRRGLPLQSLDVLASESASHWDEEEWYRGKVRVFNVFVSLEEAKTFFVYGFGNQPTAPPLVRGSTTRTAPLTAKRHCEQISKALNRE